MKLSFIIPAHNEENYITACLDSVQRETRGKNLDYEIIVVNNASTDKTGEVAARYPKTIVVNEPRKGLAQARHSGFLASKGELLANIDADTMLPKGWIETVLNTFAHDEKIVALSGPHVFYDVPSLMSFWVRLFYRLAFVAYVFNRFIFRISSVVQGGNFIVRRTALEQIGGYNPDFAFYGEDADLAKRLHKVGRVVFTLKLPIYASGRRLLAEGKIKVAFRYLANYNWTVLFGKPLTTSSTAIRLAPQKVEFNETLIQKSKTK